jgi:benzoyl-CoA reductase/2-hydroxyglutaryl-CoA dehydratase subunit BcrC/BadD/HgdB
MVLMNSCDAMRRLFDAWKTVRPDIPALLLDLPMSANSRTVDLFRDEIRHLSTVLESWGGTAPDEGRIKNSIGLYNTLARRMAGFRESVRKGAWENPSAMIQAACNKASAEPPEEMLEYLETLSISGSCRSDNSQVPIYLFGNMLPAPEAFTLFESCGAFIAGDDLCTGSRLFSEMDAGDEAWSGLAEGILNRPPCARTFDDANPGRLARDVVQNALACGAKGIIGTTAKFCDPYIGRLPAVRTALKQAGIPFLFLEGDCTLRSIGQHRTRIEAFIEMVR